MQTVAYAGDHESMDCCFVFEKIMYCSGERKGKRVWSNNEVVTFLEHVKSNLSALKDKGTVKNKVWEKIAGAMGKGFDGRMCHQKWRNLKESYKFFEDSKKKTGEGRKSVPAFYAEMHDMLKGDHAITPLGVWESKQSTAVQPATSSSLPVRASTFVPPRMVAAPDQSTASTSLDPPSASSSVNTPKVV